MLSPFTNLLISPGEYGLRNKREVWRVKFTLAKIRKAARELLTLDEKDAKRLFEGKSRSDKPDVVQDFVLRCSWLIVHQLALCLGHFGSCLF